MQYSSGLLRVINKTIAVTHLRKIGLLFCVKLSWDIGIKKEIVSLVLIHDSYDQHSLYNADSM